VATTGADREALAAQGRVVAEDRFQAERRFVGHIGQARSLAAWGCHAPFVGRTGTGAGRPRAIARAERRGRDEPDGAEGDQARSDPTQPP
jgi:hypothetical protein